MFNNERDVEIPQLLQLVKDLKPRRFLDIGAFYSYYYYANDIKPLVGHYTGVDVLPDPITSKIVDDYLVGNANSLDLGQHDLVACISTIEHAGISTYKNLAYEQEGDMLFQTVLNSVASKGTFILTFPYGMDYLYPDQFMNITPDRLNKWVQEAGKQGFHTTRGFWLSEQPAIGTPWEYTYSSLEAAKDYDITKGCQCVCVLKGYRE